jgi:hypothetical protein
MNQDVLMFHKLLELQVKKAKYGQLTVSVSLENGMPVLKTLNMVYQKRIKYVQSKTIDTTD